MFLDTILKQVKDLSNVQKQDLYTRLCNEDKVLMDLSDGRDSVTKAIEFHSVSLDALKGELERYEHQLDLRLEELVPKDNDSV